MIILQLLILLLLIYAIYILLYSVIKGAPFAALSKNRIETMFKLLATHKNKSFVDLGSGDGRIVIEAARHRVKAFGYEINPIIYLISIINLKRNRVNANINLSDYWLKDLSGFDYIAVWGAPLMMARLEKKLLDELKPGAKVVSNYYKFPNWKHVKKENDVYLYVKQ